jgi:hypothetical protein
MRDAAGLFSSESDSLRHFLPKDDFIPRKIDPGRRPDQPRSDNVCKLVESFYSCSVGSVFVCGEATIKLTRIVNDYRPIRRVFIQGLSLEYLEPKLP